MLDVIKFILLGLGPAAAYVLLAQGIVLTYRGSGVVNFAQSAIAIVGGFTYWECVRLMPTLLAVLIGVLVGAAVGLLIQVAVMWPMRRSSALARVIATLGVLAVIQQGMTLIYGSDLRNVQSFLPTTSWHLGSKLAVGVDRLWLFGICVLISVVAAQVYRRTRFGLATTAVAENSVVLASRGWSPAKVAAVNWGAGGALASLAGILLVPIVGLGPTILAATIVPALAAALIGNFTSFSLTLLGGVVIGILESETTRWISAPGWSTAVPFLVIVFILAIRGRALPVRSFLGERLPRVGSGKVHPALPLVMGLVLLLGTATVSTSWNAAITVTTIYAIFGLSLVVVTGYCGQISLAQFAIGGMGALFASRLADAAGLPFLLALGLGVALSIPVGLVVALPAIRARGVNLAIATLGLALVIQSVVLANPSFTGGPIRGTVIPEPKIFGWSIESVRHPARYAAVVVVLFAAGALLVANLRRSRAGRAMIAVRENERAAASVGVGVIGAKMYAFTIGSALAGLGGGLLVFGETQVNFDQFSFDKSINVLLLTVIGGIGFIGGAILAGSLGVGGVGQQLASELFTQTHQWDFWLAVVLVVQIIIRPDGLVLQFSWYGARVQRWIRGTGKLPVSEVPAPLASVRRRVAPQTLELRDLVVSYGGVQAIDHLNLVIEPGQVVGLIGPNGAGKTSAIDAASGFTRPSGGEVLLNGVPVRNLTPEARASAGLVRSWQSLELFDAMTVEENIRTAADGRWRLAHPIDLVWARKQPLNDAAMASIEEFGLQGLLAKMPTELNNAQRRLLGIARAVATAPSVLLLDEPTAGLDANSTREVAELIRRLATHWGMGILLVEHDVSMVMAVCDKVVAIDFGKEMASGSPAHVRSHPGVISSYLGDLGASTVGAGADLDGGQSLSTLEGERPGAQSGPSGGEPSEGARSDARPVVLSAEALCVGYEQIDVLRDINLQAMEGEIIGIFGANGAGKTTLLRALTGVLKPQSGTVTLWGAITTSPLHERARNGIAYMMDERSIIRSLTTEENLMLGPGAPSEAFELMPELEALAGRKAGLLSGGEQQMLALAQAMTSGASILVCDELSLGLAPLIVGRLLRILRKAAERGLTVILVEQHLATALEVVDRGYVLRRGVVATSGTSADLSERSAEVEGYYLSNLSAVEDATGVR